jgi:plasmid stability protein
MRAPPLSDLYEAGHDQGQRVLGLAPLIVRCLPARAVRDPHQREVGDILTAGARSVAQVIPGAAPGNGMLVPKWNHFASYEVAGMATLTIKNIPEPLVRRLKRLAAAHRRSLNFEVISCLEAAAQAEPIDVAAMLARVRTLRQAPAGPRVTDVMLADLKSRGRA